MDKKATKILFSTYWGTGGWKPDKQQKTPKEDFEYAKSMGVMFDPRVLTHSDIVKNSVKMRNQIDSIKVADAFVWSLGTRELDYRSALGSYAVLQHFPKHALKNGVRRCTICGEYDSKPGQLEDLNVLNFERLKWGGVRHLEPSYAAFDLELFQQLPPIKPLPEHIGLLKSLLECIEAVPPKTTALRLLSLLPKEIAGSKSERDTLISILGYCGILENKEHPGFLNSFVPDDDREERDTDLDYPICWWKGADGVNREAVQAWFGHLI